jgi:hypothetical protein
VIRRKGLGDALVTLPAVRQLAAAWPDARLDLVIDRPLRRPGAGARARSNVLAWPPDGPGASWLLRLRTAGYDLVLDYLGNPRTAFWTALTGAPRAGGVRSAAPPLGLQRQGAAQPAPGSRAVVQFAGEAFLDPLRALGLRAGALATRSRPESCDHRRRNCSGDEYRRWDAAWPAVGATAHRP